MAKSLVIFESFETSLLENHKNSAIKLSKLIHQMDRASSENNSGSNEFHETPLTDVTQEPTSAASPPGFEHVSENVFKRTDVQIVFIGIYTLVFIFAFFGNLTVLLVILRNKTRQFTKLCLTNLAIADFCVGVFCIYQNLSMYLADEWIFGLWLCKLYWFVTSLSHTASVLILIVVCIERYIAIMYPMRCRHLLTKSRLRLLLLFVWFASTAYSCPKLYYTGLHTHWRFDLLDAAGHPTPERICALNRNIFSSKTFDTVNSVALFLVPLVVMMVLYTRIACHLYGQQKYGFRCPGNSSGVVQFSTNAGTVVERREQEVQEKVEEEEDPFSGGEDSEHDQDEQAEDERAARAPRAAAPAQENVPRLDSTKKKKRVLSSDQESTETQTFEDGLRISISFRSHRKGIHRGTKREQLESSVAVMARRERIVKSRKQITCMLIVLVLAFALCNFPFHFRKSLLYFGGRPRIDFKSVWTNLMLPMTQLAMYANSAVNPVIYFFMSSYFRKSFQRAFFECV